MPPRGRFPRLRFGGSRVSVAPPEPSAHGEACSAKVTRTRSGRGCPGPRGPEAPSDLGRVGGRRVTLAMGLSAEAAASGSARTGAGRARLRVLRVRAGASAPGAGFPRAAWGRGVRSGPRAPGLGPGSRPQSPPRGAAAAQGTQSAWSRGVRGGGRRRCGPGWCGCAGLCRLRPERRSPPPGPSWSPGTLGGRRRAGRGGRGWRGAFRPRGSLPGAVPAGRCGDEPPPPTPARAVVLPAGLAAPQGGSEPRVGFVSTRSWSGRRSLQPLSLRDQGPDLRRSPWLGDVCS